MIDLLLERIKYLENELDDYSEKLQKSKEKIVRLIKECKINKDKKESFKKEFKKIIKNFDVEIGERFFENNFLKYEAFLNIVKGINYGYLVLIDADYEKDIKNFMLGFLTKKITPFFTLSKNIIIGFVGENEYKELKKLKTVPYYNSITMEFSDIPLYKVFFSFNEINESVIQKAEKIFKEFRLRPIYKNKHFIEYSLEFDKIVDFEREKLNKQKEKYSFVFEEPFANLEIKVKREKDIAFILAVLERIDKEMEKIKSSKGISNIVIRILNYIEFHFPEFNEEINYLRSKLKV